MRFTLFSLNGYLVQAAGATHLVTMDDPPSVGLELGDDVELCLPPGSDDDTPIPGRIIGYWAHANQPPPALKKHAGVVPRLDLPLAEATPPVAAVEDPPGAAA